MSLTPDIQEAVIVPTQMTFPTAMKEIKNGKKITRLSWGKDYGVLQDGYLMLNRDGQFYKWLVNDGDIEAEDFVVVQEDN